MKIVFATNNPNKLEEIQMLMPEGIEIISLKDIGCTEDIPETGNTLEANALSLSAPASTSNRTISR